MAVYGPSSNHNLTTEDTTLDPITIYGCTKIYMEALGNYYKSKFGLDFRSIRYPGVLTTGKPGGGTTDYVTWIFYEAVMGKKYTCYLTENTELPMVDQEDLVRATIIFIFLITFYKYFLYKKNYSVI